MGQFQVAFGWPGWTPHRDRGHVEDVVPPSFSNVVRVFHAPQPSAEHPHGGRWHHVARQNGRIAHPEMQWEAIRSPAADGSNAFGDPRRGSLNSAEARALSEVLREYTAAPDDCRFAVWVGWGQFRAEPPKRPTICIMDEDYYAWVGPIDMVGDPVIPSLLEQRPNYWWPRDLSWCVATNIDLMSTYVGCDAATAVALEARDDLESAPATFHDRIAWDGDQLNPRPPRT